LGLHVMCVFITTETIDQANEKFAEQDCGMIYYTVRQKQCSETGWEWGENKRKRKRKRRTTTATKDERKEQKKNLPCMLLALSFSCSFFFRLFARTDVDAPGRAGCRRGVVACVDGGPALHHRSTHTSTWLLRSQMSLFIHLTSKRMSW
jgi:hypothetical protein